MVPNNFKATWNEPGANDTCLPAFYKSFLLTLCQYFNWAWPGCWLLTTKEKNPNEIYREILWGTIKDPNMGEFHLCVSLSNVGAYQWAPCHNPALERVDHTLVQILTLPDRCSSNQPGGQG